MPLEILHITLHILLQGLVYSFVVMGVYLSSRVVRFDDLTTEGSFGLGGALTALLIVSGISPWLSLPLAMAGGALAGLLTATLHTKMKMNNLISGLVVTTALFSICLKLAKSNIALPPEGSIFVNLLPIYNTTIVSIVLVAVLAIGIFILVKKFLLSEIGLLLKATGTNPQMVTSLGRDVDHYKMLGLSLSNSLTALAGSLFVQCNSFFSITGNVGTLVIGLAGLILAEMMQQRFGISLILGAILYQAIFSMTIELGLEPIWNNLVKAALIVLLLQIKPSKQPLMQR